MLIVPLGSYKKLDREFSKVLSTSGTLTRNCFSLFGRGMISLEASPPSFSVLATLLPDKNSRTRMPCKKGRTKNEIYFVIHKERVSASSPYVLCRPGHINIWSLTKLPFAFLGCLVCYLYLLGWYVGNYSVFHSHYYIDRDEPQHASKKLLFQCMLKLLLLMLFWLYMMTRQDQYLS